MENQVRVLHIDTGLEWRGGQRQALTLHKGLLSHNIESLFICNQDGELYQICQKQNEQSHQGFDFHGEYSLRTRSQIKKIINDFRPTIIHCHDSHSVALGGRFHHTHTLFHTRRVSYPIKFLSRYLKYRNVDVHVCVSEDIRRYMLQHFNNTFTIHSCVDLKRFQHKKINDVFEQRAKTNLVYVGAFSHQKGLDILMHAFSKLTKNHTDVALHLVGDGELLTTIQQLSITLNIDDKVRFYGARKDVENFYLNADYVVCPSISGEGSSGVIKEGMAAGKIVIASDLTANKELIDHRKNGLLFKNESSDALTDTLSQVIDQTVKLNTQDIQDKVALFDCQNTVNSYIELYKTNK